ncbi:MAG: glycosyl transferase family 2 [Paracoccaceae bacterium]|nr:glycosyl transferase family 2 [Paracoccaceae bacterium]
MARTETDPGPRLSVVVPTFDICTDAAAFVKGIVSALERVAEPAEIILVGGTGTRDRVAGARAAVGEDVPLVALETSVAPGEEEALKLALGRARGELILTLPGWRAPTSETLSALFAGLDGHDFVTGSTLTPEQAEASSWRRRLFHWSVGKLFGARFSDLFCRIRLGHREVFDETAVLGVRQHFIPAVADWRGFDVVETVLPSQGQATGYHRPISLTGHFRAMVDLLMLYVVLKFLHRPLRFFSAIGAPLVLIGGAITTYLVIARALQLTSLVDRPLLTFGVLFIVLGVQIIAIGLIGEIIVYTSNRRAKTYEVKEVLTAGKPAPDGTEG